MAIELMRQIFLKHEVSAKYYEESNGNEAGPSEMDSILKWGKIFVLVMGVWKSENRLDDFFASVRKLPIST